MDRLDQHDRLAQSRRNFLKAAGGLAATLASSACVPRATASPVSANTTRRRAPVDLPAVDVSWDRVIRTTVGLRPHRDAGFVVRADRLDDKLLIHNYGHGGTGFSLGWGTGLLATELALTGSARKAAVVGSGAVGLMAARQLQHHGFDVTIYAAALPPDTTSNMAWAAFTPTSGLVSADRRTPEWDAQFRRAVDVAYREHQLLVGQGYGVSWIDDYAVAASAQQQGDASGATAVFRENTGAGLMPPGMSLRRELLEPGMHPFPTPYASVAPTLRFEPSIYLAAMLRDVVLFGGKIVVRKFDSRRDLAQLSEPVIVNCTGLGAKALFGDDEVTPVKGQLVVLVPQAEVRYTVAGMMPRSDGIVLGHVAQPGVWDMSVDDVERKRVVERAIQFFAGMRPRVEG
jgi:glycine/D-amino acid oxidase-like deaminating enzyme